MSGYRAVLLLGGVLVLGGLLLGGCDLFESDGPPDIDTSLLTGGEDVKNWTVVRTGIRSIAPKGRILEFLPSSTFASSTPDCGTWSVDGKTLLIRGRSDTLSMRVAYISRDSLVLEIEEQEVVFDAGLANNPGCTKYLQEEFVDQAGHNASGITETDVQGQVIREDPDDWRTAPLFDGMIAFSPAFPNPVSATEVRIPVQIFAPDQLPRSVDLVGLDGSGDIVLLDKMSLRSAGWDTLSFQPSKLSDEPGLYRLFVFVGTGEFMSYGDVRIE